MKIDITCDGTYYLDFKSLIPFQGELKTITDENLNKLKASIVKYGYTVPAFVWEHNGNKYILDAHQRQKALQSLFAEGYEIPDIPIVYIQAADEKEAKEKLLHITSQYGEFDRQGLDNFILDAGLDISALNIRLTDEEMRLSVQDDGYEDEFTLPDGEKEPFQQITFTLSDIQAEDIKGKIAEIKQLPGFSLLDNNGNENSNGNALHAIVMNRL